MTTPMTPATLRRLMAENHPDARTAQRVQEAHAFGALAGLLILAALRKRSADQY